jgi:hypothetical protein
MKDYVYVVLSNPTQGSDAAFNDWYDNTHLADVLAVEGVQSARRFKLIDNPLAPEVPQQRYLSLYYLHTGDPFKVIQTLTDEIEAGRMVMSEAFDLKTVAASIFEAIGPTVTSVPQE